MADATRDFGAYAKCGRRLLAPTGDCFNGGCRVEGRVSFDGGQFSAVEAQEIAGRCVRREKVPNPLFKAPRGTADVEHCKAPFSIIVAEAARWEPFGLLLA